MEDINSNINADLEVRKLQDLVKKLEQQNEQLRCRSSLLSSGGNSRPVSAGFEGAAGFTGVGFGGSRPVLENPRRSYHGNSFGGGYDSDIASCNVTSSLYKDVSEESSVLDEVEILDLEDMDCLNEEEDSWLYEAKLNSPLQKALSPIVWCRQALDNPSPEMESAKRSLLHRLDLTMSVCGISD